MKKMIIVLVGTFVLGMSLNAAPANIFTNEDGTVTSNASNNRSSSDSRFLAGAAQSALHETALGTLAQSNSSDADVQAFGATLVDDSTAAYSQASDIGTSDNIAIPADETKKDAKTDQRLSNLSGSDFDAAFLNEVIKTDLRQIQLHQTQAQRGANADVRAYARDQLPVLVNHLVTALNLQEQLGLRSSSGHQR